MGSREEDGFCVFSQIRMRGYLDYIRVYECPAGAIKREKNYCENTKKLATSFSFIDPKSLLIYILIHIHMTKTNCL